MSERPENESDELMRQLPTSRIEDEVRAALAGQLQGGRRVSKVAPFTKLLRARYDWFHTLHVANAMTWEGWAAALGKAGLTDINGKPPSARALKGAYLRESKLRRERGIAGAGKPATPARPQQTAPAASPPTPAPKPAADPAPVVGMRSFRPVGGERDWTGGKKQGNE